MGRHREVEIKIKIEDAGKLRTALKEMGAREIRRVHEVNALFDTREREFRKNRSILRLRRDRPVPAGQKAIKQSLRAGPGSEGLLTFKGLVRTGKRAGRKYKVREEIEYRIRNSKRFERLLRQIGLKPWFHYEKFRTTFRVPAYPGLKFDLDETPIGVFLELEGSGRRIDRAAKALGYCCANYITESYFELYAKGCARTGAKAGKMTFRTQKSR